MIGENTPVRELLMATALARYQFIVALVLTVVDYVEYICLLGSATVVC